MWIPRVFRSATVAGERSDGGDAEELSARRVEERPTHPTATALVLMIGIAVAILILAVVSTSGTY